jgi:hypothetical protein
MGLQNRQLMCNVWIRTKMRSVMLGIVKTVPIIGICVILIPVFVLPMILRQVVDKVFLN